MCFGLMILARLKYTDLSHLCFEPEVAIEKLRKYNSPGIHQIPAQFGSSSSRWVNAF
jgi:hypothetical protein